MIKNLTVAVPASIVSRDHFEAKQVSDFERITGILNTRRWKGNSQSLVFAALNYSKVIPEEIGAVIVVTQTPDRLSPCLAVDVHRRLNLAPSVPVFDVNQSCTGFVYGCWLAERLMFSNKDVLMICVDRLRPDTGTTEDLIFSDGASVAVISHEWEPHHGVFFNDGTGAPKLEKGLDGILRMDGGATFDFVTGNVPNLIKQYDLRHGRFEILAGHQSNLSMMKMIDRRSAFLGRSLYSIGEYGNMSMVSIPCALAMHEDVILGRHVLMAGYGAGWCAALLGTRWSEKPISRIIEV